jgi:phage tail-like protein
MFGFSIRDGCAVLEEEPVGMLITPLMDCLEHGNVWLRLLADVECPEGASVTWLFYAAEHPDENLTGRVASFRQNGAFDFLLRGVEGRYCMGVAAVRKPEGSPPVVIRSIQVFSAWESFLQYLPEIFRIEHGFLDRFLRLFSTPYLELEQKIDRLAYDLDPRVAPHQTLHWLASVIGIPHSRLWEEGRLRKLLTKGLYRQKGRFSAIAELVELFTGYCPYVVENFRMLTGEEENDCQYKGGDISIFLPPEAADTEPDTLHLILIGFLPSGVTYRLRMMNAYLTLSNDAYIGINTSLGQYAEADLGVNSRLNFTVLGDSHNGK